MSAFDTKTLDKLESLMGDELLTLLNLFCRESAIILENLSRAIARNDRAEIRLQAHSLKGASSNLGASDVHSCCVQLEQVAVSADALQLEGLMDKLRRALAATDAQVTVKMASGRRV